ncbi:hypothetical protein PRIPAC_88464 [Pristionchus pacificus]|uniref:MI domain-containing protein n=1 Tax=Pristionchus pacificus TaxID=54126 RepID=A0A2A6CZG9_PRIPA|nr:hypothetical protein PRIPAC_88464 [Pristionchus pacificus]|eukprot:PDM83457.1 hypothetical protein PRIPAC_35089 [Pristionchus pacificus]
MARTSSSSTGRGGDVGKSRKTLRKEAKQFKKLRNTAFNQKKNLEQVIIDKLGAPEEKKKKKTKAEKKAAKAAKAAASVPNGGIVPKSAKELKEIEAKREEARHAKEMESARRIREKELAKKEQKEIDKYAKKLGFKNTGTIGESLVKDGLSYILEMCDRSKRKELAEKEKDLFEKERVEKKTKKAKKIVKEEEDEDEMFDGEGSDMDEEEEEMDDMELELMGDGDSEDDFDEEGEEMEIDLDGEDEDDEDEDQEEGSEGEEPEEEGGNKKKKAKEGEIGEDIYGRTINKKTGELIDFNPRAAHLKLAQLEATSIDGEERRKVERAVRGALNLLSESTLVKTARHIGELFHGNSKNEVKSALTKTLLRLICDSFRVQDRIMAVYGAFVALVHTTVSAEISSHLIEAFFVEFVNKLRDGGSLEEEGKAMENRAVFAAHLLSFKIIRGEVVMELLAKLRENLDQSRVSLILVLIRYGYKALKRTVNISLNDFIAATSKQLEDEGEKWATQPRMRFLIEELNGLRKTVTSFETADLDHMTALYHGMMKKETNKEHELGMSLEDLMMAEERGRWWIVGSAFRLPTDGSRVTVGMETGGPVRKQVEESTLNFDAEILDLAKRAGMNTEVRRNVFCSVVSAKSEDDAFERLLRLSLKGTQEREIIHILITMLLKEKKFNPFYVALLRRFSDHNKRFPITIQYALWDRLRELDVMKKDWQREHIADLVADLLLSRALTLMSLKVIEWGEMSAATTDCLKRTFAKMKDANLTKLTRIFECIMDPRKNRLLHDGLRLFLQMHFDDDPVYAKIENTFATWR